VCLEKLWLWSSYFLREEGSEEDSLIHTWLINPPLGLEEVEIQSPLQIKALMNEIVNIKVQHLVQWHHKDRWHWQKNFEQISVVEDLSYFM
jgi:hypothetical protein